MGKMASWNGKRWTIRCYCGNPVGVEVHRNQVECTHCRTRYQVILERKQGVIQKIYCNELSETEVTGED